MNTLIAIGNLLFSCFMQQLIVDGLREGLPSKSSVGGGPITEKYVAAGGVNGQLCIMQNA
jgi:hypothetical protein